MTGVSGSGKSSLAFDTIYAEGQRRYVESLSAYARQFLNIMQKPDLDSIDGLSPAIAIEQKKAARNPRSTVGTITEIYDYMRLLWARIGIAYSPATGLPVESQSVSQMVDRIMLYPEKSRFYLMAPIIRDKKGEFRKEFAMLRSQGYLRVKIDGEFYELSDIPALEKNNKHSIYVVVDRLAVAPEIEPRLADSLETALKLADGIAAIEWVDKVNHPDLPAHLLFSQKFLCPVSGFTISEIEPRLFSFNSPHGACEQCEGLGSQIMFSACLIVPDPDRSLAKGAIAPWAETEITAPYYMQTLRAVADYCQIELDTPWRALPSAAKEVLLYGSKGEKIDFIYDDGLRCYKLTKPFEGVIGHMKRRYLESESERVRARFDRYRSSSNCPACQGYRLKTEALSVKIANCHIGEVTKIPIREAEKWFAQLPEKLTVKQQEIARQILKEIKDRLGFLDNVGLEYLTLSRLSGTLSGGEGQRIRLASQIGSGLTGVLYVLDEPSIGLHQRDNQRLLATLQKLRDLGNTVIVVEHDEETILAADYVVDIGVGAGRHGGHIVAKGPPAIITAHRDSLTGQYLSGRKSIPVPATRRIPKRKSKLVITGAHGNNLQNLDVTVPLGLFVAVTGVSGSGKSTFAIETIYREAARRLNGAIKSPSMVEKIQGFEYLDKVIDIDQSPIGRTPRSNPATYIGAFTPIREWFAQLPESRARGYVPGRFSFNVKGGRCEACQGDGVIKVEMHFLPDIYVKCDVCDGARYNRETLQIAYRDANISNVLDMTVEQGCEFFAALPAIRDKLETLRQVGLGYIKIGQQATTLSGGEAQRVKLARELARKATGRSLYILDEPTTGLHFDDIRKLLDVLHILVDNGNSMIVIEHNLEIIKTADWVIDLGPEGGNGGGQIVAAGTPEEIAEIPASYTGHFLSAILSKRSLRKSG